MELFNARKLKFKAWNSETKLLVRLHSMDCVKGELKKANHTLLQFTGLYDEQDEEIYDMDVLLKNNIKYIVCWKDEESGWCIMQLNDARTVEPIKNFAQNAVRLRSYFEPGS